MTDGAYPWMLVGGTAVTLAMLKQKLYRYDPLKVGGTTLSLSDLQKLSDSFFGKHPDELQALPGMPLNRGHYILAGTLLMIELFSALQITEGTVTERGLRHGLWLTKFWERGDK
jgi:exopolyphosphatase/guanosine-5'-triphosphate,3'-diphosphate pyrophosphatase